MWSRVARTVLGVLLVVVLGACGDDEPGDAGRTPGPTASSSSGSPTTSETAPAVEPATGELFEINALRMRLFEHDNWDVTRVGTTVSAGIDGFDEGIPGAFEVSGGGLASNGKDLEINAEVALEGTAHDKPRPKRVDNRVINGVECYVLAGEDDQKRVYVVGGNHGGYLFDLEFTTPIEWPDSDELIESMLASIEWK